MRKTNFEIEYLKIYLDSSLESLRFREDAIKEKMIKDIKENPENESFVNDLYEKEISKLSSYFYHSSIVLIYTLLENTLYNICLTIQLETSSPLSYDDLAGGTNSPIKKSKNYLQIVTGIEFSVVNKMWDRITQFQKLRNDIAHQNLTRNDSDELGRKKDEVKLRNMFPEIRLEGNDFFLKDSTLPLEFIDLVDSFLSFVYGKVEDTLFLVKCDERGEEFDGDLAF